MKFFVVLLVLVLTFSLSMSAAIAGSPFAELCLKVMGASKKTVEKEINTVGRAIKGTADVIVEEGKDVGALLKGDGSKAKDVLVKPVKGATAVAGEAAYGVLNAPIEAGKEIAEEDVK